MSTAAVQPLKFNRSPQQRAEQLKVNEIFFSLQGESVAVGLPTVFVRLTGCPLRCGYCDSEYAFYRGEWMSYAEIEREIARYNTAYVCLTGGEPLAQRACVPFLSRLLDLKYCVSLETSGAIDLAAVDPRVVKVMDLKTPASTESHRNRYENLECLNASDQIKFVICDRGDYEWSREQTIERKLSQICEVLFSPSYAQLSPQTLAMWILEDSLPVRFQIQLHKYLWGDKPGV